MKVLFAVNNDNISDAIVKKYQKEYREILSYKNVYYFNAILKELQKDTTYDRVVISEDLEPFANNNYDTIDKFLFDKLDNISDEATDDTGDSTEIILICADRRNKSDNMLIKLFGIGVYSAIVGQDRSVDEVCRLINKPRTKKEAKIYYKIEADNVNYQSGNESNVSEAEVQNILAHYKRLGKNEDKYVDSFNNIVSQYTDTQLKIIIRYLPMNVKAVLEERSQKYQELVTFNRDVKNVKQKATDYKTSKNAQEDKTKIDFVEKKLAENKITKPIVIPEGISRSGVKKLIEEEQKEEIEKIDNDSIDNILEELDEHEEVNSIESADILVPNNEIDSILEELDEPKEVDSTENVAALEPDNDMDSILAELDEVEDLKTENNDIADTDAKTPEEPVKRGRGRPRKIIPEGEQIEQKPKRGRGRPRKIDVQAIENDTTDVLTGEDIFDTIEKENNSKEDNVVEHTKIVDDGNESEEKTFEEFSDLLAGDNQENLSNNEDSVNLFGLDDGEDIGEDVEQTESEPINLFGLEEEPREEEIPNLFGFDDKEEQASEVSSNLFGLDEDEEREEEQKEAIVNDNDFGDVIENNLTNTNYSGVSSFTNLLTKDKKVVAFVGTTKNGTSFVVNNIAELLSTEGISVAILDMTKSRNAYYIYTKNEENLRRTAADSIYKLKSGIAEGIKVNKNLSVYTSMPGEEKDYSDAENILATLVKNYSLVLIDCDFNTDIEYFANAQEIYLVQSMDVLTIQPLTGFLRNLKSRDVLKQEKIKIVINKEQRVRSLSAKTLIGGMAFYNDPGMSYMTELFDKDGTPYCAIPFEIQTYVKYLEGLVDCEISLNGYSKAFMAALRELGSMVYPLISRKEYSPRGDKYKDNFSNEMNDTLSKMKRNHN